MKLDEKKYNLKKEEVDYYVEESHKEVLKLKKEIIEEIERAARDFKEERAGELHHTTLTNLACSISRLATEYERASAEWAAWNRQKRVLLDLVSEDEPDK